MVSIVAMLPELNLGVVVLTNQEDEGAFESIANTVLDHYLDAPPKDWVAAYAAVDKRRLEKPKRRLPMPPASAIAGSKPSLAMDGYVGRYRDPWYGDIVIEKQDDGLGIRFTTRPG